ncbi:MAG: ABC transporter permease [Terriglobales bacterium]
MWNDLRYTLRSLRRHRGLTAVIVLTLALAIGANTAIFSVMDGLLLRALPVRNSQSLLLFQWEANKAPKGITSSSSFGDCRHSSFRRNGNTSSCSFSVPFFHELQRQAHTLAGVTAFGGSGGDTLVARGEAARIRDQRVAGNYFQVLGLKPELGRLLTAGDNRVGAAPVMVLSYQMWQQRFGGDRGVVGTTVELNRHAVTIVGVAKPTFTGLTPGSEMDAWVPLSLRRTLDPDWTPREDAASSIWLVMVGRAKPGVSQEAAQAEVSGLFRNAMLNGPKPLAQASDNPRVTLVSAQSGLNGARGEFEQPLVLLLWLVGAILLIACANIAGLLVGRAQVRSKEFALRRALGAGSGRIVRQLLSESLLLAVVGGIVGLGLAWVAGQALVALLQSSGMGRMALAAPLDARVLAFALGVTILTGILSGLVPALHGARGSLAASLKDGLGNSTSASGRRRWRWLHAGNGLVVAQVALCVVVLAGAGLLVRTLENLRSVDPGFATENLLLFSLAPGSAGYHGSQLLDVLSRVQNGIAALPGVRDVSYASSPLLAGDLWDSDVRMEPKPGVKTQDVQQLAIGLGYFQTMHVALLRGRVFRATDFVPTPPPGAKRNPHAPPRSVIVNQSFVQNYVGGGEALGREFGYDNDGAHPQFTIIGVVGNTKYQDLRTVIAPTMYTPLDDFYASFVVRTAGAPMALLPGVRRAVHDIDANMPVVNPATEAETIDQLLFQERMLAKLASLFAALALLLAAIGLYALLAQEVTRRTREIGIRMALGAERRQVLRLVVGLGLGLAAGGIGLGLAGALAATRYLHSLLYGVGASDPLTLTGVGIILLGVAFAACWLPARRATHVDPMVALRYE